MSLERQEDNTNNPWWGEHLHRYEEAAKLIAPGSRVLDIACGTGFGSDFLAKHGCTVTGADLSEEAIAACRQKYGNVNPSFEVMDGTRIPYADATFDAVVSFETIEHTTQFQGMLNEFKRIVKKDGLVIISTPNFLINSPGGVLINPFHTQEWTLPQLQALLDCTYPAVTLYGQCYTRYSHAKSLAMRAGRAVEKLLYRRGVRKLPISMQDRIMQSLIHKPMYPLASDYALTQDPALIGRCKTFFAICKP